jgi:hypothetical protein
MSRAALRALRQSVLLVALVVAEGGCVHGGLNRDVSRGSPTTVDVKDVPVHGFNVKVERNDDDVEGELLAVEPRGVWVLPKDATTTLGRVFIPASEITNVRIDVYPTQPWSYVGYAVLGTLSTISHGFFLIFTGPTWLLTGISTAIGEGASGHIDVPRPEDHVYLYQFARFPAGMPPAWTP